MKLEDLLIGRVVKADHPITCLNPSENFIVKYVKQEDDRIYVRGDETMWFCLGLIEIVF